MRGPETKASVVLVHGAWADGSSWAHVIRPLQSSGLKVLAAPIPLTSLSDDIAALERALERVDGSVVLAGHAYAGAVIARATVQKLARSSSLRHLRMTKARQSVRYFIATSRIGRHRNCRPILMVSSGFRLMSGLSPLSVRTPQPSSRLSSPQRSVLLPPHAFRRERRGRRGTRNPPGIWSLKMIGCSTRQH